MLSPAKGTRDVHRAPAGGEPGPRLRHAARRTARQKRERYHLLPPPTGVRDLRQAPAGGIAGERGLHGPRPSVVKTRGLSRCETKKNTWRHLLQCATGTRDMRLSPAGERGAPDPRPSGFRKRGQARPATKKVGLGYAQPYASYSDRTDAVLPPFPAGGGAAANCSLGCRTAKSEYKIVKNANEMLKIQVKQMMTQNGAWQAPGAVNSWPFNCVVHLGGVLCAFGNYRTGCWATTQVHTQNMKQIYFFHHKSQTMPFLKVWRDKKEHGAISCRVRQEREMRAHHLQEAL